MMDITRFAAEWIDKNINQFHEEKRLKKLRELKLSDLTSRKNPYLFKVKGLNIAADIVRGFMEAAISSSEETQFGNWMEQLAIAVAQKAKGGQKSSAKGIDLELEENGIRYLITIKSGPNWGNSGQIDKMIDNFRKAAKILRTSGYVQQIEFINGCIYGKDTNPYKEKGYYKYCGQVFWRFISGSESLYLDLIEPLGIQSEQYNQQFKEEFEAKLNLLTQEFLQKFCTSDGRVDWNKLLKDTCGK
ncbi:hypothetical protein Hthe01_02470 [Hydrogenophilus thermoluteolus]|uniref:PmeII family type II restriction endonuclease n=1 Tax=Hydrogenophilus thermoluteolus TaxID=297 RepID=UPI0024A3FAB3|nr:PmeII family type II restriction endonuclease [Hydrogenophilus thermoluteolus]GLW59898.1 hypothetical protein Hthe01_02470 [Hydrogenophilus thermoluteolus]